MVRWLNHIKGDVQPPSAASNLCPVYITWLSMQDPGWIVVVVVAFCTYVLYRNWAYASEVKTSRKLQYPAGRKHRPARWLQLCTDWRYARSSLKSAWSYLKASSHHQRDHNEATCPVCNWGPEPWVYIDEIVRMARSGCQFSSYLEQAIRAFCEMNMLELVNLVIAFRPYKGTLGLQVGSVDDRGWGLLELFLKDDIEDESLAEVLPTALKDLLPQRDAFASKDVSARIAYFRKRMEECAAGATMCSTLSHLRTSTTPPGRVLQISRNDGNELFITLQRQYQNEGELKYSCLSYCWGGDQAYKLTASTAASLKRGMPANALPKTLSDAVLVSWELGVLYIWIDALCIFQDDHEDWIQHASQMSQIYSGACVTICASQSTSANSGFLSPPEWAEPLRLDSIDNACARPVWARPRLSHRTGAGSVLGKDDRPLMRRAWTYQEDLLSLRCLRFEEDEITWECLEGFTCECRLGSWQPNSYRLQSEMMPKVFFQMQSSEVALSVTTTVDGGRLYTTASYFIWFWHQLVEHYWLRELTHETDRLVALEGIVETLKWRSPEYYAGIWGIKPHWGLAWQVARGVFNDPEPRRPRAYRAPSWSWASTEHESGSRRVLHPNEEPIAIAEVQGIRWLGVDAEGRSEGHDLLEMFTFACQKQRTDCEASLLETICYDCAESRVEAEESGQLWLVALAKEESNRAERLYDYMVLICTEVANGKVRRLGITHRAANLDGYSRQTVLII